MTYNNFVIWENPNENIMYRILQDYWAVGKVLHTYGGRKG